MTLILTLGNSEQIIQISDRRLSWNGQLVEDESNKAAHLVCANARLAFGFTGVARWGGFVTRDWLLDAVFKSGPPDGMAKNILERLRERASEDFMHLRDISSAPKGAKRLSIMFSGYLHHHDPPLMGCSILTNFQNFQTGQDEAEAWDEFKVTYWSEKRPLNQEPTLVQRIGSWQAMTPADEEILRKLLEEKKPARAIIGKAVDIFREMSDRPTASGTIGKQLSSIRISSNPQLGVESGYHSNVNRWEWNMTDMLILDQNGQGTAFKGFRIQASRAPSVTPLVVPKVGRNHPCPCGSGKKYKYCHGS